jgi:hypothetical protein
MKIFEITEAKVEMCPEACCGKPVTECKCGPECEHCDCHEKNKMNEDNKGISEFNLGKKISNMMGRVKPQDLIDRATIISKRYENLAFKNKIASDPNRPFNGEQGGKFLIDLYMELIEISREIQKFGGGNKTMKNAQQQMSLIKQAMAGPVDSPEAARLMKVARHEPGFIVDFVKQDVQSMQTEGNESDALLDPLKGAAAELFGKQPKKEDPEKIALDQAMEKYKNDPKGLKAWLMKNRNIIIWLNTNDSQMLDIVKQRISETTTAGDVAAVANPPSANAKIKRKNGAPVAPQKKNKDGTAKNALELGNNLMGGGTVKR